MRTLPETPTYVACAYCGGPVEAEAQEHDLSEALDWVPWGWRCYWLCVSCEGSVARSKPAMRRLIRLLNEQPAPELLDLMEVRGHA